MGDRRRRGITVIVIPYMARISEDISCGHLGLHWGDQMETEDKTEGTPGCLCLKGMTKKLAVVEPIYTWETTTHCPLGGDHSAGPWQRTGGIGERCPAHPDDTLREAFQQRWKIGSPCMVAGPL